MTIKPTRYWFEFDVEKGIELPPAIGYGCGVTAFNLEDATYLISKYVFKGEKLPPIKKVVENIDVGSLDQVDVVLNMNSPHARGIWFPLGYDWADA